jgi:hypothetical protein
MTQFLRIYKPAAAATATVAASFFGLWQPSPPPATPTTRKEAIIAAQIPGTWEILRACPSLNNTTYAIGGSAAIAALVGDDTWRGAGTIYHPKDIDVFVKRTDDIKWTDPMVMALANATVAASAKVGGKGVLRQITAGYCSIDEDGIARMNNLCNTLYSNPTFPNTQPLESPLYDFSPAIRYVITIQFGEQCMQLILCDGPWRDAQHLVTDFTDTRVACTIISENGLNGALLAVPAGLSDSLIANRKFYAGRKGDWSDDRITSYTKRGFRVSSPGVLSHYGYMLHGYKNDNPAEEPLTHHYVPLA